MNRLLTSLIVAIIAVTGMAQDAQMEFERFWWVYLVSGDGGVGFSDEQVQEMQTAHRANLRRLGQEKKLIVAAEVTRAPSKLADPSQDTARKRPRYSAPSQITAILLPRSRSE